MKNQSHNATRAAAALLAVAFAVGGCNHTIRLDPGSEDASVYVNGDLRGSGVSKFEVEDEYGFPESFTAKVYPASGSAFSVEVAREFDWGRGIYRLGTDVLTGVAFMSMQYISVRDQIAAKPGDWPVLMFPAVWSLGFLGGLIVLSSPFDLMRSFHYREFYDLERLRDAQDPKQAAQTLQMRTSE